MESCMIRVRISAGEAHYGGGLVDGAHILKLFGDVATELIIRSDGDEGLCAGYESVEFLAPVYAGDYIEAKGRIVKVGTRSRVIELEAHKVIRSVKEDGAESTAEVVDPPILVARAVGTSVVPKS